MSRLGWRGVAVATLAGAGVLAFVLVRAFVGALLDTVDALKASRQAPPR
jgi:hypothetical protein